MKKLALFALALVAFAPAVMAGTDTANLAVSATVANECNITTGALAFGAYDPITTHASANLDGAGSVTVTCTDGASVSIGLGAGLYTDRQMSAGDTDRLEYELYSDSGRTAVWTNVALGWVTATGDGAADEHPVYGRVPANQSSISAGSYSDTVVATVTF